MNKWDERFLELCDLVKTWSKDSTQTSCICVGDNKEILSVGFNGIPRGVKDEPVRYQRPQKYLWCEHAERNMIYNAARTGTRLLDKTVYMRWFPCADCARALIQSGIATLFCDRPDHIKDNRWAKSWRVAETMLKESGMKVVFFEDLK